MASSNEQLLHSTQTVSSSSDSDYPCTPQETPVIQFTVVHNSNESSTRYVLKRTQPKCKCLPKYNFGSFIEDKLHALSPVTMGDDNGEDEEVVCDEVISDCFESSVFSY